MRAKNKITETEKQMGLRFKEIRTEKQITYGQIYNATGVLEIHTRLFEAGQWVLPYAAFSSLAAYIDVSCDYFLGIIHEPRPPLAAGERQWS